MTDKDWEHLRLREGFREDVYPDGNGWSIGVGTLMPITEKGCELAGIDKSLRKSKALKITEDQAKILAEYRWDDIWSQLLRLRGDIINTLPEDVQTGLHHAVYQLGAAGLNKFNNMWSALSVGDYARASDEARDSLWYKQTPIRVDDLTDVFMSQLPENLVDEIDEIEKVEEVGTIREIDTAGDIVDDTEDIEERGQVHQGLGARDMVEVENPLDPPPIEGVDPQTLRGILAEAEKAVQDIGEISARLTRGIKAIKKLVG